MLLWLYPLYVGWYKYFTYKLNSLNKFYIALCNTSQAVTYYSHSHLEHKNTFKKAKLHIVQRRQKYIFQELFFQP
jgi:hypothetical protein